MLKCKCSFIYSIIV